MDPVDTENENLAILKEKATCALNALSDDLSLHDFRIVSGDSHTNVLFDVVLPFESKLTKADIVAAMEKAFADEDTKFFFVVDIDRKMS